jgi:alginate O-acetyltransferase complex protein AlgI
MLFSSLEFLYLFLPLTLLVYFCVPLRFRNPVLLVFSLIFYGWGEPIYVFLMIFTILVDYVAGLLIERAATDRRRRAWLITAIAINLLLLAFFKYSGFLLDNLRRIPALSGLPTFSVALPIGISFYTFQALSYVIDIYRRQVAVQKDPVAFGTYVTLFPQLIAGPIVRYSDVDRDLTARTHSVSLAAGGVRTFVCGLCKKVLLANTAGSIWATMRDMPVAQQTTVGAWLGILCFTIQIYFDFSGYSDMAIGLGRILGFRFPENFYYPMTASSITDYWRRWHITLSTWFREYVYIPLGGNRCGKGRTFLNLLIVWLLTGLWHGASWNFVLWGVYFFVLLAMERLFLGRFLEKAPRVLGHVWTLLCVVFSFYIFVFDSSLPTLSTSAALSYLGVMFGAGTGEWCNSSVLYELLRHLPFLALCIVGMTPLMKRLFWRLYEKGHARTGAWLSVVLSLLGLLLSTAYLVDSAYNPFLYFRF